MNVFATPLPDAVKRRSEIVGMAFGGSCFFLALYAGLIVPHSWSRAEVLALPIVFVSTLAGAVGAALLGPSSAREIPGISLRVGTRAGFIASLGAGALSVLASTLHSVGIGAPAGVEMGSFISNVLPSGSDRTILVAALTLPPSLFFGFVGALIVGFIRNKSEATAENARRSFGESQSVAHAVALVFLILCYVSPFFAIFQPKAKVPQTVVVPKPVPAPAPAPPAKWRYEKPADFNMAVSSRVAVVDRRGFGEVSSGLPFAISPDEHRLAFCRQNFGVQIQVIDLNTLDIVASGQVNETPASFAWSPDSKMLFIVSEGGSRTCLVLDVDSSRLMQLPQPKDHRVPEGRPRWLAPEEVVFTGLTKTARTLDLATLRATLATASSTWKGLSNIEREVIVRGTRKSLFKGERWEMRIAGKVHRYDIPLEPGGIWTLSEKLQLAVFDANGCNVNFQEIDVERGDVLLALSDGTKLVQIRGNGGTVFFFGIRPESENRFSVEIGATPDPSITAALSKNLVSAFVCAPLINPLNGRVVGPDRSQVKGIARIAKWEGTTAEFWIDEEYRPAHAGDVVADLHAWKDRIPASVGEPSKAEWHQTIENFSPSAASSLAIKVEPLDRELTVNIEEMTEGGRIERILTVREQKTPQPPPQQKLNSQISTATLQFTISSFIKQYHALSSQSDVGGMMFCFADRVDYMSHGIVGRDFIAKDLTDYHGASSRISDAVISDPSVEVRSDGDVDTTYLLSFHRTMPDGKWFKGVAQFSLRLKMTSDGPKISAEHIKLREQQKGP